MKINFCELAVIEKQSIPQDMDANLKMLNEWVNSGIAALGNLSPNIRKSSAMRGGRIRGAIENLPCSRPMYQAAVFAGAVLSMRQTAMQSQLHDMKQTVGEYIPSHEVELQKQLSDATLSGDVKAADSAVEGLQRLRQRIAGQGEMQSRMDAIEGLLEMFQLAGEVLSVVKDKISPTLWREYAESLHPEYVQLREQITTFVELHHQIKACEWFGKEAMLNSYKSPLPETEKLFAFDQERHKQVTQDLRKIVTLG